MKLNGEQKGKKLLLELKDLLVGAAFPFMLQLIFSASVILFASYSDEIGISIAALVFGELLLAGAYIIFGRQNGIVAYRRTVQNNKKREAGSSDARAVLHVGEYALYKGFIIALISCVPFIIFQIINAAAPNKPCEFVLMYAFGWAWFPFGLINRGGANLSEWLNLIWITVPIAIHAVAYLLGARKEKKKQLLVAKAQELKGKRNK
ncbi:MAG: hypothetical protein K2J83_07220 [Clostridia bacterium]|nr:hypothetical protein [Clostridia bacterium]